MPICKNCNRTFSSFTKLDSKTIDSRNRKYCLICNPVGSRNFWRGKEVKQKNTHVKLLCETCKKQKSRVNELPKH